MSNSNREDSDIDDDFSDLYKEYTGPPRSNTNTSGPDTTITKANKRSYAGSDEEDGTRDPNAVPTDFTSREAKVWEAKSKATERNWKKRKEEEMICKICGESGHFTQGCPSTLGANRKSQDFFERVPARDPQVKALFSEKVIRQIEKDIGCKIKMEEKFMIVSGKDRLILAKGVDAVHKIKNEGDKKVTRSRSPEGRSPISSRMGRSNNPSPRNPSHYNQRFSSSSRQEKMIEDVHRLPRGSPQLAAARAYGNDGARGRSTHSKSPYSGGGGGGGSYDDERRAGAGAGAMQRNKGWVDGTDKQSSSNGPQTLEDLHLEYQRDAMDITEIRDKEEDEENNRHRQAVREMREDYMKRFGMVRAMHAKQWEEFLQVEAQRRQQPPPPASGFGGYKQDGYPEYESSGYGGGTGNMGMDSRVRYPDIDTYPSSRSHDSYGGEFQQRQSQRHEDYGKAYNNNNNNNNRY
uniref:CCHC-type domain-containing protein n=1 Tax=Lactuca sativa TaxID=4236 RepID=A0A9R1UL57_LACSA|nr:hypothetical protein LSAT_V11C800454450 [Lactuca sativa]